jgi:endogenous inhibitor of DNA gyrase (YacG/DUF329 family)
LTTLPCPHCGAEISANANFCRHCGSSDADGWRDDSAEADDEDDFDYDAFVEQNFSSGVTNTRVAPLWRFVALLLLLAFVIWALTII